MPSDKAVAEDHTPPDAKKSHTHVTQTLVVEEGYVSGCQYEEPHYQLKFDRFSLQHVRKLKGKRRASPASETDTSPEGDTPEPSSSKPKEDPLEKLFASGFSVKGRQGEFDMTQKLFTYSQGVVVNFEDGTSIEADRGTYWLNDQVVFLEGHISMLARHDNFDLKMTLESLILNLKNQSGIGISPRLEIRNPRGVLGLGRGSRVKAILKGKRVILHPMVYRSLDYIPSFRESIEAEGGQAKLGQTALFDVPKGFDHTFYDIFAGFKAGRNSRHGVFVKSRLNLFEGHIPLGSQAAVRARVLGLENWYEKRGWGHGLDARYTGRFGPGEAIGNIYGLVIDDKDLDHKNDPWDQNTRFFGRWMHRGHVRNDWDWNWELSRESDPYVREEFDRRNYRRNKPFQNRLYLARKFPEHRFSLMAQVRSEDFVREVDYLPRLQWDQLDWRVGQVVLDGHVQFANARLNQAEAHHNEEPSIRAERLDVWERLALPKRYGEMFLEPYAIGNATWYNRRLVHRKPVERAQTGVGMVLAQRYRHGVYRLLPKIDMRKMFEPTVQASKLPQIDAIDDRRQKETIDLDWRYLMRGHQGGKKHDIWNIDMHVTAFPNRKRDNDGKTWSLFEKRIDMRPHPSFDAFAESKYDLERKKYEEVNAGFVLNPQSRLDIGTDSNGRDIFTGNLNHPNQIQGLRSQWSFSTELRYTDDEPSVVTGQLDLIPRDKWRLSYAQEWTFDGGGRVSLHRIKVNRDLHDWTLSFDWEIDAEDNYSQSFTINLTPHDWGEF